MKNVHVHVHVCCIYMYMYYKEHVVYIHELQYAVQVQRLLDYPKQCDNLHCVMSLCDVIV